MIKRYARNVKPKKKAYKYELIGIMFDLFLLDYIISLAKYYICFCGVLGNLKRRFFSVCKCIILYDQV